MDIRQLRDELDELRGKLAATLAENQLLRAELTVAREEQRDNSREVEELEAWVKAIEETSTDLEEAVAEHTVALSTTVGIETLSRWLQHAPLQTNPLVSVVLPTCDRPRLLDRAIRSVRAQRYEQWELLVVDDGPEEGADAVVESVRDSRISLLKSGASGPGAARNIGLRAATGQIVTYLDDDNMMDCNWLCAVVWAFEQRPDVEVLYGAQVVDDIQRLCGEEPGAVPSLHLEPFDRDALRTKNPADMSAVAHRSSLSEAWLDENLREFADWDFLLRLTHNREPLVLPAVAVYYTTDALDRLTGGSTEQADYAKVAQRAARGEYP